MKNPHLLLLLAVLLPLSPSKSFSQNDADMLDCVDATVRVKRSNGRSITTGSGSIFMETEDYYGVITNHHVAGSSGSVNEIDIWNYGRLAKEVRVKTYKSWFTSGNSRDVAILRIPKSSLPGELPVIPLAPYGASKELKVGQTIFTVGCSNGRWPRLRVGTIVEIRGGVIYYEPTAIGGDSGGPVYAADGKTQIGLTAWRIERNGKQLGMAMTSDRVRDILNGRVGSGDFNLPEGAQQLIQELPKTALRVPLVDKIEASQDLDFWRQPGTNPAEGDKTLPTRPAPMPRDILEDTEVGLGLFKKLQELILGSRTRTDEQFEEQAGILRDIIASRRAYRLQMERLRQEELQRQRQWEEEQRNEWAIQQGFLARTISKLWWWVKLVGWGVGITTVTGIVAMFFGQAWGTALLFGLGNGIFSIIGMLGKGFGNLMNMLTGLSKKIAEKNAIEDSEEDTK